MGGMGLKLTPVLVRCLLGFLGLFEPTAGASWAHSYSEKFQTQGLTHLELPNLPHHWAHHTNLPIYPLIHAIYDNYYSSKLLKI